MTATSANATGRSAALHRRELSPPYPPLRPSCPPPSDLPHEPSVRRRRAPNILITEKDDGHDYPRVGRPRRHGGGGESVWPVSHRMKPQGLEEERLADADRDAEDAGTTTASIVVIAIAIQGRHGILSADGMYVNRHPRQGGGIRLVAKYPTGRRGRRWQRAAPGVRRRRVRRIPLCNTSVATASRGSIRVETPATCP